MTDAITGTDIDWSRERLGADGHGHPCAAMALNGIATLTPRT
jgi:hypothetical protein